MKERHVIIGTSGHIDHGKSAIVKALTGTDPDRLQEEKERGMTIDLGYAFYGERVAFIDVPGHERFVKNMVAGVTTIDFVMLVVAADDGVMPQTREHLDILQLLGVQRGLVVLNKIDLVEPEWLDLVEEEIRELVRPTFLRSAPVLRVSAATGQGIPELKQVIDRMVAETPPRPDRGFFWEPIDRSFSIQGFGTVVTGSVLSGTLRVGQEVELLPQGRILKVRGLQRHGKPVEEVALGDRAAVNLLGIHREEIGRGNVLATPGYGQVSTRLDVRLQLLPHSPWSIRHQERVRLHVGTSEVFARCRLLDTRELSPGAEAFVQFVLEAPLAVNRYDRFVIRKYSPPVTIGGGIVLDQHPLRRHKRRNADVLAHLSVLASQDLEKVVLGILREARQVLSPGRLAQAVSLSEDRLEPVLRRLLESGALLTLGEGNKIRYVERRLWEELLHRLVDSVKRFHLRNPHLAGVGAAELASQLKRPQDDPLFVGAVSALVASGTLQRTGKLIAHPSFKPELGERQKRDYEALKKRLRNQGFAALKLEDLYEQLGNKQQVDQLLAYGKSTGELVVLANGLVYLRELIERMQELIRRHCARRGSIRVAEFRDLTGTSRKYAVAILEYFDEVGFTVREGDERRPA